MPCRDDPRGYMAGAAETEPRVEPPPQVSRREVLNCALPSWYNQFKTLTFKTVFISLPEDFVAYLNSDGLILPENCILPSLEQHCGSDSDDSDSDKVDWSDTESNSDKDTKTPDFPELIQQVTDAIGSLGGAVIPKLNWSSPKDATWIAPSNTLMCTCPAEVLLLLKSSDFIGHDLSRVFEYCSGEEEDGGLNQPISYTDKLVCHLSPFLEFERWSGLMKVHDEVSNFELLCLRKWTRLHPSAEFRCFVYDSQLIAISQRDPSACYHYLSAHKETIRREIASFFQENIAGKFPNKNYIFDVYRIKEDRIRLVDFNPYCPMTDALLFTWDELSLIVARRWEGGSEGVPIVRVVEAGGSIQPSDLQSFRLPKDVVDLSTGEDIHKFVDLVKNRSLKQECCSDEDENK